jgi:hypothetical protein
VKKKAAHDKNLPASKEQERKNLGKKNVNKNAV